MLSYFFHPSFSQIPHRSADGQVYILDAFLNSQKIVQALQEHHLAKNSYSSPSVLPNLQNAVLVHDPLYLNSLVTGKPLELAQSSGVLFNQNNVTTLIHQVEASYQSFNFALHNGFSYDLSGGNHHAGYTRGAGFGVINTFINAIARDIRSYGKKRILIIDTDVYLGDANALYLQTDIQFSEVRIFDLYGYIIPKAYQVGFDLLERAGNYIREISRANYFKELSNLDAFVKDFKPEVVLWLQGAYIWQNSTKSIKDKGLTKDEIAERDRYVVDTLRKYKVPFVMSPVEGYVSYKNEDGTVKTREETDEQWQQLLDIYLYPVRYYNRA